MYFAEDLETFDRVFAEFRKVPHQRCRRREMNSGNLDSFHKRKSDTRALYVSLAHRLSVDTREKLK